ncbi:hypothetical protein P8F81_01965 [Kosakonia cowanii]|uniref:hypothetical protein n=1 Tax=Kosakonia cowanii TaxID=208223 RepID=UPI002DDCFE87|nr:hypothetical protein [Kosakonia cowanii]WRY59822.1 hypothetical protein P8F81_01965 [Kosakonia cowanii]
MLAQKSFNKPTLVVLTEHDSVLDTRWILDRFDRAFTHPASRAIWYGTPPPESVINVTPARENRCVAAGSH